jgi:hypothetical protein
MKQQNIDTNQLRNYNKQQPQTEKTIKHTPQNTSAHLTECTPVQQLNSTHRP